VISITACAFGCKVTKSRNVSKTFVDVKKNFTTEVQKAQIILDASKNYKTTLSHQVV
jgi:hypothetical protein